MEPVGRSVGRAAAEHALSGVGADRRRRSGAVRGPASGGGRRRGGCPGHRLPAPRGCRERYETGREGRWQGNAPGLERVGDAADAQPYDPGGPACPDIGRIVLPGGWGMEVAETLLHRPEQFADERGIRSSGAGCDLPARNAFGELPAGHSGSGRFCRRGHALLAAAGGAVPGKDACEDVSDAASHVARLSLGTAARRAGVAAGRSGCGDGHYRAF